LTRFDALRIVSRMDAAELMAFAEELASTARIETLPRWANEVIAEDKGAGVFDPVTEADRQAELAMRALIRRRYPDHGITGEEWPDESNSSGYCWSLDPIDGTRSFMCGLPTWVTLIGLLHNDQPLLGLIDAPVLDETYFGTGNEAWLSRKGERGSIRTSGCTCLSEARLSTTDPFLLGDREAFERVRKTAQVTRYGHDGYGYARVAAGSLDLVIESGLKPHDYNALIPVIRGAGGHIGDWVGGCDFTSGAVVAAATRQLYDSAAELLAAA
jgi:histidinol phosphatase-like enzyme (inositol monophosphatase family)